MKYLDVKLKILSYIYQLRTLSYDEIFNFFFINNDLKESYCTKILKEMISEGLLEKIGFRKPETYYYITKAGISLIVKNGIVCVGSGSTEWLPVTLYPSHLKLKDNHISHQLELNHFVLNYERNHTFDYFDEKYLSNDIEDIFPSYTFSHARPDGVIVEGDTVIFLEMDMNTERKQSLGIKWKHYREFLLSEGFYNLDKNIKVYFILGGQVKRDSKRSKYLAKQITDNLSDHISNRLNFYIGTENELLSLINYREKIEKRLRALGYNILKDLKNTEAFNGFAFDFYINKVSVNGKVISENGYTEEFVVDDMTDMNIYSLVKVLNIASILSSFKFKYNRELKYIIVVKDEYTAYNITSETGIFNRNIYFTTMDRLSSHPLNSALFQINKEKDIWHFSEKDLGTFVFEGKIRNSINKA